MAERQQDLEFASQTRALVEAVTAELALATERAGGGAPPVVLAHLVHRGREDAGSQKMYDYSRRSIERRWRQGREDMRAALAALEGGEAPTDGGMVVWCFHETGADAARRAGDAAA